jgi:hypothetical protein
VIDPWYTTRERVKRVLDIAETAHRNDQVDDAIEHASRDAEGLLKRRFYPWTGTRYFDWPRPLSRTSWRIWLDGNEMVSVSAVTTNNGATTLTPGTYRLRRADDRDEPPYTYLELDRGTSAVFSSGTTTQRAVAITGVYCGCKADTAPAGALAEGLDASETGVDVTDSASIGIGSTVIVDSERMLVTGKSLLTTGQTLQTPVDATEADTSIAVTTGSSFTIGEIITLNSERMRIDDIAGNTLVVERAVDGTALAAHTGSTIYAPRTLTVVRGALGTTAATHSTSAALTVHQVPGPVVALSTAYALNTLLQQQSGYARVTGSGDNQREFTGRGIRTLEQDAIRAFGRQLRMLGAV